MISCKVYSSFDGTRTSHGKVLQGKNKIEIGAQSSNLSKKMSYSYLDPSLNTLEIEARSSLEGKRTVRLTLERSSPIFILSEIVWPFLNLNLSCALLWAQRVASNCHWLEKVVKQKPHSMIQAKGWGQKFKCSRERRWSRDKTRMCLLPSQSKNVT